MSTRYIKKRGSKHLYLWNPILAKRSDMIECDASGRPVVPQEVKEAETPPETQKQDGLNAADAGKGDADDAETSDTDESKPQEGNAAIQLSEADLETADRKQLQQIAESLKLDVHPNTGADKLRAAVKAKLFPED